MSAPPLAVSRRQALLDVASFLALGAAAAGVAVRVDAWPAPAAWPWLALAAVGGIALADLGSGVFHWFCDTWFAPDTPWIGRFLIAPFREHHVDPLAITRRGALEVSGSNALLGAPLLLLAAPLADELGRGGPAAALGVLWSTAVLAVVATNQIHCWAHVPRPPRAVAWLQRAGLLLSPAAHARHHRGRQRGAYCVTVGWCNPLLDGSGVLVRIERRIGRMGARHAARREA